MNDTPQGGTGGEAQASSAGPIQSTQTMDGGHLFIKTDTPGVNPSAVPYGEEEEVKNNTGEEAPDPLFWDKPKPDENAPAPQTPEELAESAAAPMKAINDMIAGLDYGKGIVPNEEMLEEMSKGDFTNFNAQQAENQKTASLANLQITAKVVQGAMDKMTENLTNLIESKMDLRQNTGNMLKDIPQASDPVMRPVVEGIYAQALTRNKGDAAKAKSETEAFLSHIANSANPQIDVPTGGTGARQTQTANGVTESAEVTDFSSFFNIS